MHYLKLNQLSLIVICLSTVTVQGQNKLNFDLAEKLNRYVTGCSDTEEKAKQFGKHPRKNHYFGGVGATVWRDCNDQFNFTIVAKVQGNEGYSFYGDDAGKYYFVLEENGLDPGEYFCYVSYRQANFQVSYSQTDPGHLVIVEAAPVAYITGGDSCSAPPAQQIILSAKESALGQKLQYAWTCTQTSKGGFCGAAGTVLSTQDTLEIPGDKVKVPEVFDVTLKVTRTDQSTATTVQKISVLENSVVLHIQCNTNCRPKREFSSILEETSVSVKCVRNCDGLSDDNYEWTIAPQVADPAFKFDYEKDTKFGRKDKTFAIKESVLTDRAYVLSVKVGHGVGESSINLVFEAGPGVTKCYTLPLELVELQTPFKFFCEQTTATDKLYYEVYIGDDLLISGLSPDVFNFELIVPSKSAEAEFYAKISVPSKTALTIKPIQSNISSEYSKKSVEQLSKSVKALVGLINPAKPFKDLITSQAQKEKLVAAGLLQVVICDVLATDTGNFDADIRQLRYQVVDNFLRFAAGDVAKIMAVVDAVVADLGTGKLTTDLAALNYSVGMRTFQDYMLDLRSGFYTPDAENLGRLLAEVLKAKSQDLMYPGDKIPTDEVTFVDVCVIKEETKRYLEFLEPTVKAGKQESVVNIIESTKLLVQYTYLTTEPKPPELTLDVNAAKVVIKTGTGQELASTKIVVQDTNMQVTKDLAKNATHSYNIILIVWKDDVLADNDFLLRVATDTVVPQVFHATWVESIRTFKDPMRLSLDVRPEYSPDRSTSIGGFSLTQGYPELAKETIQTFKVLLFRGGVLHIKFSNITEGEAYEVVIVDSKYPELEDFDKESVPVTSNSTSLVFKSKNDGNIYVYVGILPDRKVYANKPIDLMYGLSFQLTTCVRFQVSRNVWDAGCKTIPENVVGDKLICECDKFSILSGYVENIQPEEEWLVEDDIVLELQSSYVIFFSVLSVYIAYAIFAIFAIGKKKEPFYYLADNLMNDLYAYLIIVRTSNAFRSGTTSAVAIKLIGDKDVSLVHVLNYPDPQLRLLQRFGEDTFVMTAPKHLGDIKELQLWYSCTGSSTTWYCRDILIYDLQERKEFYFFVNRRLFILTEVTYMAVQRTERVDAIKESIWSRMRVCGEYHSWYLFSSQEKFAYMKRLTVVLSTVMTNFCLTMAFHGMPHLVIQDCFDENEDFYVSANTVGIGFSSSSISFTLHIAIAWIFRISRIQFSRRRVQIAPLHFAVTILLWVAIVTNIIVGTSLLLIYGFWSPQKKSYIWLVSGAIGVASEIFICDNLVVLIHSLFTKNLLTIDIQHKYNVILRTIETQRTMLYERFGAAMFRPYLTQFYEPLQQDEIQEKKIIVQHRQRIAKDVIDMFAFTIYFILLLSWILGIRSSTTLESKNSIKDMMLGKYTRSKSFTDIQTIDDIYDFVKSTLIPAIHPHIWYGSDTIDNPGMLIDLSNKVMGVVRIRQHRMRPDLCKVDQTMRFLFKNCYPEFRSEHEETQNFGNSWRTNDTSHYIDHDRLGVLWLHIDASVSSDYTTTGHFTSYPPGGYQMPLGRQLSVSEMKYRDMYNKGWIDAKSRSVIIEFLTYSANSNMFNSVQLLYEQSATGHTSTRITSTAARMLNNGSKDESANNVLYWMYHLWVAVLAIKHALRIVLDFRNAFRNLWFLLDLSITVFNIATIICINQKSALINSLANDLREVHHERFLKYFDIYWLEEAVTATTAFVLTLATLRLWQYCRFGIIFRIMERTLALACFPLLAATLAFMVVLLAFGNCAIILIGYEFKEFYSFLDVSRTLITMSLKPDQFDIRDFLIIKITYPFFAVYLLLMQIILFVYIIIIIMAYTKAQIEFSVAEPPYTIKNYVQEQAKMIPMMVKNHAMRLVGGESHRTAVMPKADEFRYANCLSVPVTNLIKMQVITKSIIRHIRNNEEDVAVLSENDWKLMSMIVYLFTLFTEEDDKALFFKGHFAGKRFSLVDEKKIMIMEPIVMALLTKPQGRRRAALRRQTSQHVLNCGVVIKKNHQILKRCDLTLRMLVVRIRQFDL